MSAVVRCPPDDELLTPRNHHANTFPQHPRRRITRRKRAARQRPMGISSKDKKLRRIMRQRMVTGMERPRIQNIHLWYE
jgi:hypothetical protein